MRKINHEDFGIGEVIETTDAGISVLFAHGVEFVELDEVAGVSDWSAVHARATERAYKKANKKKDAAAAAKKKKNESVEETEDLNEAKKLGSKVTVTKGVHKGKTGVVRQIQKGRYGDPSEIRLDLDLDDGSQLTVDHAHTKVIKESAEETEDLNELKSSTLAKYIKKASDMGDNRSQGRKGNSAGELYHTTKPKGLKKFKKDYDKAEKRGEGIARAASKLGKRAMANEDVSPMYEGYLGQKGETGRDYHNAGLFDKVTAHGHAKRVNGVVHADGSGEYLVKHGRGKNVLESVELDEEKTKWKIGDGRPRNGASIENDRFWNLPYDELKYIAKDAGEAMRLNPTARKATTGPGNWADQVADAATVMHWRKKNGIRESVELDEAYETVAEVEKQVFEPYNQYMTNIRSALKTMWEAKQDKHTAGATAPEEIDSKASPKSKEFAAKHNAGDAEVVLDVEDAHETSKSVAANNKKATPRTGDKYNNR